MSAPSPGQLRPNSAIYIGAAVEEYTPPASATASATSNHAEPLRSPGNRRTPHLPSPPHTSSTSGSAGERELSELVTGTGSTRTKRATIALPTVTLLDKLDRFGTLGKGRAPGGTMSPASRTTSLGRSSSASAVAAVAATNSMRHSQEKDVFDRDEPGHRSHHSLSVPRSTSNNSDADDRSPTPPATPAKRLLELAQNASPGRQRLVSEPTSPRRLQMLRDRTPGKGSEGAVNLSSPLRESTALGESELHPPEADRSRQPSPGLYASEGAPSSPGLYISESTDSGQTREGRSGSIRAAARRPRPPGIRNSIDRSYEQWEREQMGDAGGAGEAEAEAAASAITPRQSEIVPEGAVRKASSAVGSGVRSVVNEGLRAAGLTRARKVSDNGSGAMVASPTTMQARERMESLDMVRSGSGSTLSTGASRLSSERERSRSRMSREREPLDMDSLRERATRNAFFSPNVRGTRTIHNVLNPETAAPLEEPTSAIINGRETPANLRLFKQNYTREHLTGSTPLMKAYTSPSGTQRHLPSRSVTALNIIGKALSSVPGTPSPTKRSIPLGDSSTQSSPNTVNGTGPVNLLQDALWMFESHVQRLPPSSVPEVTNDVLKDARGIVNAAIALNGALRGAAAVCVDEQIEAEVSKEGNNTEANANGAADVWRRVGAEFREDARVADELVRALTSFMIGAGRMLRVSNSSSGHARMSSISGADGSISRGGGSALGRGSSISRAGGSSDGRRSVEGWSRGIGMSGAERRSMDGRRSVEPGTRRSAEEAREETMRRLTSRQGGSSRDMGEAGSNGSGGSRSHRVSFQGFISDSRPGTSLSARRELPRISQEDSLSSPGPRTFTSLSSRRSTGARTPATGSKALPRLPMPNSAGSGELTFPQSQDGGDRTPIELPRPHMRHSTMPPLAVPPPLPTLPSESLVQRSKTIGKHAASNSITSASTTSTTRPQPLSATVRGSSIVPSTGSLTATTAVTPTTARPRQTSFNAGGESPTSNPFSMGRARGSAAVNGLQQIVTKDSPRKRTISNADAELQSSAEQNSSSTVSSMAKSSSGSQVGFPSSSSRDSPSSGSPNTFEPRRSGVRPTANRRTSSTFSGASTNTITSSAANGPSTTRPRAVTRISSAGTLSNPIYGSRSSLVRDSGNSTESGTDQDRKLKRTNVRLSFNGIMDRRGGIGELLSAGRKLSSRAMLEGDERDVGDSPSLNARERRERRRVAEEV
ncbi:hypothetical protein M408DRAFT_312467 [Serendipita vermifera MAFF 305830]|uniref:Uncharacterized protein n=1 Tax=Serendipita vermifera MAFF 305830 TaxID=933852 RepID=A0A0C2WK72_SERVB|nr:hypothetical protein M408DRAFT_312467 [Serendipita vermifera MAFF 305830]